MYVGRREPRQSTAAGPETESATAQRAEGGAWAPAEEDR